jgi:hypothetical protein
MVMSFGIPIDPEVGFSSPASIFSRVDLPAPFLPVNAILSVLLMTKLMSLNRGRAENSTHKLLMEIMLKITKFIAH